MTPRVVKSSATQPGDTSAKAHYEVVLTETRKSLIHPLAQAGFSRVHIEAADKVAGEIGG
jgi:hypothetical protein